MNQQHQHHIYTNSTKRDEISLLDTSFCFECWFRGVTSACLPSWPAWLLELHKVEILTFHYSLKTILHHWKIENVNVNVYSISYFRKKGQICLLPFPCSARTLCREFLRYHCLLTSLESWQKSTDLLNVYPTCWWNLDCESKILDWLAVFILELC